MDNYLQMTDHILDDIERSSREDLAPARDILQRIKSRELYTLLGSKKQVGSVTLLVMTKVDS